MELIFAYIKKFGDFIHDQSIQFSNDFEVHLENKILTVREKKELFKRFLWRWHKKYICSCWKKWFREDNFIRHFGYE